MTRLRTFAYLMKFFTACMPIFSVYSIMFAERSDLTTSQISQLFFLWLGVALVSEIPTGVIADRLSRRWLMVGATTLQTAVFAIWLSFPSFGGYAAGFIVWGVCWAMYSGAFQAYLYDELATLGRVEDFNRLYVRCDAMLFAGKVIAYFAAAALGASNYTLLLVISIASGVLCAVFTACLPRERRQPHAELTSGTKTLRLALSEVRASSHLSLLAVTVTAATASVIVVPEYVPLFYKHVGVEIDWVPILLAVGLIISTALSWTAHAWMKYPVWMRLACNAFFAALFLLSVLSSNMFLAALGMLLLMRVLFLTSTLHQASLQHAVSEKTRATVGSLPMFVSEAAAALTFATFGLASHFFGDKGAYLTLGSIILLWSLVLMIIWIRAQSGTRQDNTAVFDA